MNTNALKSFAKEARKRLLTLVEQRVLYWGIDKKGNTTQTVEPVKGGYIFRGETFSDESIPRKWQQLKSRIKNDESFKDVIEEAAYTWFNRLIAIRILQKNGYDKPVLDYAEGTRTPAILQEAKRGQSALANDKLLKTYLQNDDEERAFALLLIHHIRNHVLLRNVFGHIEDFTELLLPDNLLSSNGFIEFLNTTKAITDGDYKQVELIGWLYQFCISDKKDEVFAGFKNNRKARAEDIPAATQIFTPKWIVKYMVENTVGKIWLDYEPDSPIHSEMKYLVAPEDKDKQRDETIIKNLIELTLLDPAVGSGHILVEKL
jgi:hypothetical protein